MSDYENGEYEPSTRELRRNFIGYTSGFLALSNFRTGRPTCIAGSGRGGTTAMMRCFVDSPGVRTVSDMTLKGCNLETTEFNTIRSRGSAEEIRQWVHSKQSYDTEFVVKSPVFEAIMANRKDTREGWDGNNILVMYRDPVAIASRQKSVQNNDPQDRPDKDIFDILHHVAVYNLNSLQACHNSIERIGVAIVSYEKLLSSPERIAEAFNEWTGQEMLSTKICKKVVQANNTDYLNRQTRTFIKHRKRLENGEGQEL